MENFYQFALHGGKAHEYDARRSEFPRRLKRYNIEVDNVDLTPSSSFSALGLEFDLKAKRFRMDSGWVENGKSTWLDHLANAKAGASTPQRELLSTLGALIWADYARGRHHRRLMGRASMIRRPIPFFFTTKNSTRNTIDRQEMKGAP